MNSDTALRYFHQLILPKKSLSMRSKLSSPENMTHAQLYFWRIEKRRDIASDFDTSEGAVKDVLALHTFVQMKIGSFKILKAAASAATKEEIATICNTVLEQLTVRASWLDEESDEVTRIFLTRKAA